MQFPVFDIHAHVYPEVIAPRAVESLGKFYDLPVVGRGTYDDLEAASLAAGVKGLLLFSVATNAHQVSKVNDGIAKAVALSRAHGLLTVGFAGMHQEHPDPIGEMERAMELGLCGVKIHPDIQGVNADDPRFFPLYAFLEQHHLPLCLHIGDYRPQYAFSGADKLLHVADRFPDLRINAAHLGGYGAWSEAPKLIACPNVFIDTSSSLWVLPPERASELILAFGTDRVMFGTDYPIQYPAEELKRFFALPGLTDAQRKAILYDNAIRFLGL